METNRAIELNKIRWGNKCQVDWKEIQKFYDSPSNWKETKKKFGLHNEQMSDAIRTGLFKTRTRSESFKARGNKGTPHTKETREKLSKIQSDYLTSNPDKHPWRKNSKFISVPCEHLKKILKEKNISFIEEFQVKNGKNYSIDILIENVAIEVNGNQHYNKDGSLKPYYQIREDFIKSLGYEVINVHYSKVFDQSFTNDLILKIGG